MEQKEQQFEQLFHSEYGRMYRLAYILLGDEDEAKDAVQDVFASLWDGSITLREESQRSFLLRHGIPGTMAGKTRRRAYRDNTPLYRRMAHPTDKQDHPHALRRPEILQGDILLARHKSLRRQQAHSAGNEETASNF